MGRTATQPTVQPICPADLVAPARLPDVLVIGTSRIGKNTNYNFLFRRISTSNCISIYSSQLRKSFNTHIILAQALDRLSVRKSRKGSNHTCKPNCYTYLQGAGTCAGYLH